MSSITNVSFFIETASDRLTNLVLEAATPEVLVPYMTAGWSQCDPPAAANEEVTTNVHD